MIRHLRIAASPTSCEDCWHSCYSSVHQKYVLSLGIFGMQLPDHNLFVMITGCSLPHDGFARPSLLCYLLYVIDNSDSSSFSLPNQEYINGGARSGLPFKRHGRLLQLKLAVYSVRSTCPTGRASENTYTKRCGSVQKLYIQFPPHQFPCP